MSNGPELCVLLRWLHPDAHNTPPQRMSGEAAGYDVVAAVPNAVVLTPGARALIPTGFALAIPSGYECQVRPRSGLAIRHGVTVLNSPGTIDADYRGEVRVALINLGDEPFCVEPGMRVAQLIFAPITPAALQVVAELPQSDRGTGGFGSTGLAAGPRTT